MEPLNARTAQTPPPAERPRRSSAARRVWGTGVVALAVTIAVGAGCANQQVEAIPPVSCSHSAQQASTAPTTVVSPSTSVTTTTRARRTPASSRNSTVQTTAPDDPTPTPSTSGPAHAGNTISLAFAGDVHFEQHLAGLLRDPNETWAERMPELTAADFSMVNLETAITDRGAPEAKQYTFRAPSDALAKLHAAGVDAVTLANNHAADYGPDGVTVTLAAKRQGPVGIVGFGADESEAYAALTVIVKGVKVGVFAATQVDDETYRNWSAGPDSPGVAQSVRRERFARAAREAVATHDVVVAYLHWGTETASCPDAEQVETARMLREAGVDVIVGSHAHRLQGHGMDGRALVAYGLGNHVWYHDRGRSRLTGVLTVSIDADAARARGRLAGARRADAPSVLAGHDWTPRIITPSGLPELPRASKDEAQAALREAQACSRLSSR